MHQRRYTRRDFLRSAAGTVAVAPLLRPSALRAATANDQLHVAAVGVGNRGRSVIMNLAESPHVRFVAFCDVDATYLGSAAERFPGARTFRDYRRMFDAMAGDINAVVCATPDHMHGSVVLAAMGLGKHVYCEKPLAHNLLECRAMQRLAAKNRLVTQMGIQIHGHEAYRTAVAMVRAGAIGKVREVHSWGWRTWDAAMAGRPARSDPTPDYLDWDLWLGVAAERPYVEGIYHPREWRGWTDFGTGNLGDIGCHLFDPIFSALELKPPTRVVSLGTPHGAEVFAASSAIRYTFDGTDFTDGCITCHWTNGAYRPDAGRAQLPSGVELPGVGVFMVGKEGVMVLPHIDMPRFYSQGEPMKLSIEHALARSHYRDWVDACRGEGRSSTPFSYSGPVTEAVLVGSVAGRFRDRELRWDSTRLVFDDDEATKLVRRPYRKSWEIPDS